MERKITKGGISATAGKPTTFCDVDGNPIDVNGNPDNDELYSVTLLGKLNYSHQVGAIYEMSINDGKSFEPYRLKKRNTHTGDVTLQRPIGGNGYIGDPEINMHQSKVKVKLSAKEKAKERERLKKAIDAQKEAERRREIEKKRKEEERRKQEEKERREEEERKREEEERKREEQLKKDKEEVLKNVDVRKADAIDTIDLLKTLIEKDIKNIWIVGPAGCGKSTIARIVANQLQRDIYVLSCGIGTSSTEFVGYKYPERESTPFGKYYQGKSIIVLDEFTALDPSVAQIANAALANDELYTTTGLITRGDCVIIATSNTFGTGGDMSYVANNQLDASTIDRFIGGIVHVQYSTKYEEQYDVEVVRYVNAIRGIIKENGLQRIASTRMIIQGEKLKKAELPWKALLVTNWTEEEKELLRL